MPPSPLTSPLATTQDLSALGMFLHADWVVKAVILGLLAASVATWTILLAKSHELRRARARVGEALAALGQVASLAEATGHIDPARHGEAAVLLAETLEEERLSQGLPADGVKERAASRLERQEAAARRAIVRGTGLLATIGATAPFVGLFGTVWGIMNSFVGIAHAQSSTLAVVAPGIAEALLATATGLVAAIPAVVIYNLFARKVDGYRLALADTSSALLRLLSRDLDRAAHGGGALGVVPVGTASRRGRAAAE